MSRSSNLLRRIVRQPALRPLRLARLDWYARHGGHQDWNRILGPDRANWEKARDAAAGGRRVLVATGTGGHFPASAIDRLLAVALTLRGAEVRFALCDGVLDACQKCESDLFPDRRRFVAHGPERDLCKSCHAPAARANEVLGLPTDRYGGHHPPEDREKVAEVLAGITSIDQASGFTWNGIDLGEHALAGALRFFARADLEGEPTGLAVLKRYLAAALRTAMVTRRVIADCQPEVVILHHGIYVPQGVFAAVARQSGVRVVTWAPAYRARCFLFAHDETYHHALMDEPTEYWADTPLSAEQRTRIVAYLKSRWTGEEDWIRFHRTPDMSLTHDLGGLGLTPGKPLVVALTNVMWDAQLHYRTNAFASQVEWLADTVRWFAGRPDLQLAIRVHPAELTGNPVSRQKAADELARLFATLPPNIVVVPPESALSTYDLARQSSAALIYATKAGVELAAMGLPVIAAGEAWSRNKGITTDVASRQSYADCLNAMLPGKPLSEAIRDRALRYAHHFFFRRMIPLDMVDRNAGSRMFDIAEDGLDRFRPGASAGLDVICDGILEGTPFHMPDQALPSASRMSATSGSQS